MKIRRNKRRTKTCPYCGKEFSTIYSIQRFCSKKCARGKKREEGQKKRELKNKSEVICKLCNAVFVPTHHRQRYCSKECYKLAKDRRRISIKNIREDFINLTKINPIKAQQIADEMREAEGKDFRIKVLDGLAPFDLEEV